MPGSHNFLVFNPDDTDNTDSDSTYLAQTQRLNGLRDGVGITSMHNKLFRQVSVMVAALAQFMANQGQTVSDNDVNALTTVITNTIATQTGNTQLNGLWEARDLTLVSGVLTTDALCWQGKNVQYTQPSSPALVTIAKATHSGLRYGKFSVGFRIKSTNAATASIVTTLKVLDASNNVVASLALKGTDFTSSTAYKMFYLPFENSGQSTGNAFTFAVTSEAVASTVISIDSIVVNPIHAANYGG